MGNKVQINQIHFELHWDWKSQPKWNEVEEAIIDLLDHDMKPHFYECESGGDDHGLLISSEEMPHEMAQALFDKIYNGELT